MKRYFTVFAVVAVAFAGVSCEKHRWENKVETKETPIFDKNGDPVYKVDKQGNLVMDKNGQPIQEVEITHFIPQDGYGAKSFFYDEYREKKLKKAEGKKEKGKN